MKRLILLLLTIYWGVLSSSSMAQEGGADKEILIISSYNYEGKYAFSYITNFVHEYLGLGGRCTPVVETMACQSLDESSTWVDKLKGLVDKHPRAAFIVLAGQEAWASYFSLTEEKYRKIPIACFMGQRYGATFADDRIPSLQVEDVEQQPLVDFITLSKSYNVRFFHYYEYDVISDCQLIRYFFPERNHVVVISDNTFVGLSQRNYVNQVLKLQFPMLTPHYIDGRELNLHQAMEKAAALPDRTAGILCIWRFDRDNVIHMNNAEYVFNKAKGDMPVFSLTGTGMGYWCIGGSVPQYDNSVGGELANYIFRTVDEGELLPQSVRCYLNEYTFDMCKVKEYGLDEAKLPKYSKLINVDDPWMQMFQTYKWYILLILLVILILATGFLVLLRYSLRIRQLKKRLEQDKMRLQNSERALRIAKERAEESNRLKSAFISNMSHEIRTPLNAIVGFSTILEEEIKENLDLKEYVNIISHNSDLLLKLINDILDLSRLESGRQIFRFRMQDLVEPCRLIISGQQAVARKEVKLLFEHETPTIMAETDVTRLQQVLINLVGNAVKFTKEGTVTLKVEPDDLRSEWIFSVTDTGCGIPLDKQRAVFERFCKLDEFAQGTGLGLSICQVTVKQLGGRIWIDSHYTHGARFCFTIPYRYVEHRDEEGDNEQLNDEKIG